MTRRTNGLQQERYRCIDHRPSEQFFKRAGSCGGLVGESVKANGTIANIETLMKTSKSNGYQVFISPHCYFPTDHSWQFGGTVENMMH